MRFAVGKPRPTAIRVGGAAVAMILVAEGAVWLLSPRDKPPEPVPVAPTDYFDAHELERARDFRDGQRWLGFAGLALEGAVLAGLAVGRPAPLRRAIERFADRPLRGAALAGAAIALATELATLPLRLAAHERAVDVGLSSQALGSWLWDVARATAIAIGLAAAGGALLLALIRTFPRRWWMPGAVAATLLAVVFIWIAPVLLAPIFNRFKPLPQDSRARADVMGLADRAGVDVGEVYEVDASRRVRSLNAYVDGIGPTKRVVVYDNLLERAARPELRSVVAHELGHVDHDDIPRGLVYIAIVSPLGLLFAREVALALVRRRGIDPISPAALPAYFLGLALAALILGVPGNQLSRKIEASADDFALELTDDPKALIGLQQELARTNLSDPDPPAVLQALFATHPSTVDRIGAALAYQEQRTGQ